jgi:hypothetical protein
VAGVIAASDGEFAVTGEEATLHATAVTSSLTTVGAGGLIVGRLVLVLDQATLQLASEIAADLFDRLLDLGEGLGTGGQVSVEEQTEASENLLADTILLGVGHGNSPEGQETTQRYRKVHQGEQKSTLAKRGPVPLPGS